MCSATGAAADSLGVAFNSPTGNIHCYAYKRPVSSVFCVVDRFAWRHVPVRPKKNCEGDWVPSELSVGAGTVQVGSCRSDANPYCFQHCSLGYGKRIDVGSIRCSSARNGITCRMRHGQGAGFRIAYEGYTVWRN
jgi:hypothetical protein